MEESSPQPDFPQQQTSEPISLRKPTLVKNPQDEKLPWWWSVLFITCIGLINWSSYEAFTRLPLDRPSTDDPEEFIGLRAKNFLRELTSLGPRVIGSRANEINTVNLLLKEINKISSESNGLYRIETDVQTVSGKFRGFGMIHVYESVQNVIVKITPKSSKHTNALLINSHFDSGLTSPGAGDDGAMVAIMLGVLSSLTKSKETVEHPIIFLLNGAEEAGLLAAHGFITQHKWAKDIRAFINLDALGVGGREILLQAGPNNNRLIDHYNKAARHPFGSVLVEELFDVPSFPSASDFTVFTNNGNLTGLNLIYITNGYAYHTHMDMFSNVNDGSLQHSGDNLLALTRSLANSEELDGRFVQKPTERGVYFDVLGLFFVNYSETSDILASSIIAVLSLVVIGISIWTISISTESTFYRVGFRFLVLLIIQLGSVLLGAAFVFALTYFFEYIGYTLSWYTQQFLLFGLYACPYIFITGIIPAKFLEYPFFKKYPLRFNVMLFQHAQCLIFAVEVYVLLIFKNRSTFTVTYTIFFYAVSMLITILLALQKRAHLWIIPSIICQALPISMTSYSTYIVFTIIIPLTGRRPGNPDLYVACYVLAATTLTMGLNIPVFNMFRKTKTILSVFLVVFIMFVVFVFTFVGFPYSDVTPQRLWIYHIARCKYSANGEVIHRNPVFAGYLNDLHVEQTLKDAASKMDLKYFSSEDTLEDLGFFKSYEYYGLIEGYELDIPNRSTLNLISKEELSSETGTYRYTFRIAGDAKTIRMFIKPLGNSSLLDWTFNLETETKNQDTLTASINFGKISSNYTFWVIAKNSDFPPNTMSIDLNAEYLDEDNQFSYGLTRFLRLFPNWSATTGFIASYDAYEF